jgi:ketosteroid isomerase-like protein
LKRVNPAIDVRPFTSPERSAARVESGRLLKGRSVRGRTGIERLLRALYAARLSGDLEAICRALSSDAQIQIASARLASPVAIEAAGIEKFRPLLALLIKTFKLGDLAILSMRIEGNQATVHWRANISSRITGAAILTDLIDVVEVRDGRIVNFDEVSVSR